MENIDSLNAHPSEASTDELASPSPSARARTAGPEPAVFDRRFATEAEEAAYWIGVRVGAESARAGRSPPPPRHAPEDLDRDLGREGEPLDLLSSRLAGAPRAGPGRPPRALRHDGWNPDKERVFLRALAASGTVADACRACAMSRDSAYSRRDSASGGAFALGWEAALVLARPALADDLMSRARYGVVERVYRGGELVAERHRYDNRLSMAVLTRLDRRADELAMRSPAVEAASREFEQFLELLDGGNEAAEAFLSPRLASARFEPPQFRDARHPPGSEEERLARLAFKARHGVGMPSDVEIDDLDPAEMEGWSDDQLRRAEASGLLASLAEADWPESVRQGEADTADGMCKLRKLYLDLRARAEEEDGYEDYEDYEEDDEEEEEEQEQEEQEDEADGDEDEDGNEEGDGDGDGDEAG